MPRSLDQPTIRIITVFLVVTLLWAGGAVIFGAVFLPKMPTIYGSTARIDLHIAPYPDAIRREINVILSARVLTNVIATDQLQKKWGKRYFNDTPLSMRESLIILFKRLSVFPTRHTSVLEIHAYSETPEEAADIANAVATDYRSFRLADPEAARKMTWPRPEIVEPAKPALQSDKTLTIVMIIRGLAVGVGVGTVAAGLTALWFVFGKKWFTNSQGARQPKPPGSSPHPSIKQRY